MVFKVISANIRFANIEDGAHDWCYRKNFLSECLLAYCPDLIATQEGREGQLRELHSLLPGFSLLENHRQWIPERMYPCFYYNSDTIKPLRQIDYWLSEKPTEPESKSFGSLFPRLAIFCEFKFVNNGKNFIAVNCHLDHGNETTRTAQAKVLLEQLALFNQNQLPVLLMGDFNSGPGGPTHGLLLENCHQSIKDPWIEHNLPECPSTHRFGTSAPRPERIDWILIPKTWGCREISMDKSARNGVFPSDHYPVKATLQP